MKITREDVLRVAELAHLELSEAEIEMFSRQLDSILTYVDKLNELDTSNVEPMAQVAPPAASGQGATVGTPLRQDEFALCDIIGDVLAGAPDASPPYFRVPRVIER
jgi:aspartyl-tRNA(Asn)/glutamyl-tRNA(Gln) amidotransferase subunit C